MRVIKCGSKSFRNMLGLFCIIFMLPFSLLCLVLSLYTIRYAQKETYVRQAEQLAYILKDISKWETVCSDIMTQLQHDEELFSAESDISYSQKQIIQSRLQIYTSAHPELYDIWYYIPESKLFLSGKDSCTFDRFTSRRYNSHTDFASIFQKNSFSGPFCFWAYDYYDKVDCIMVGYILYDTISRQFHYVLFSFDTAMVTDYLDRLRGDSNAIWLFQQRDRCLLSEGEPDFTLSELPDVLANSCLTVDVMNIQVEVIRGGGVQPWILYAHSEQLIWTLVWQNADVGQSIARSFQLMLFLLLILLISGIFLILVISRAAYRPIGQIRDNLSSMLPFGEEHISNDYAYIDSCIRQIQRKNVELTGSVEQKTFLLKDYILFSLFRGQISSLEQFNHLASAFNLQFPTDHYRAFVLIFPSHTPQNFSLDPEMQPYRYAIRSSHEGRSVCGIVSYAPEDETSVSEKFLAVTARFPNAWTGFSLPYDGLNQTSLFLSQAFFSCNRAIFQEDTLQLYSTASWDKKPESLSKSIELISHLIAVLPDEPSISPTQILPILSTLQKILENLESNTRIDDPESFLLADNLSTVAIRQKLRSIISSLQASSVSDSNISRISQIQLYIAQNFENPEFSVGCLADHFSMPISTLSAFFRGQTGESLSDYITRLKIERAKELLAYSTHTIGEIGMAVGYYSVSSFIRRFRSEVGMTPGEYRELQNK